LHPWSRIGWQEKKDEESCGEHADEDGGRAETAATYYTKETANGKSQLMNKTKMAHHVLVFNDTVNTTIYNNLRIFL